MMAQFFQKQQARNASSVAFWLFLIVTWFLSFISQHDIYFSVNGANETFEQLSNQAAEGQIVRRVALPLLAVYGLAILASYGRRRIQINGIIGWTMLVLFIWMLASLSWSVNQVLTIRRLVAFACMMLSALGTAVIAFERLPTFVITFCGLNFLVGLLSEIALGTFLSSTAGYRFGGTLHPNLQGFNLSLLILGFLWLQWDKDGKQRFLLLFGLLIATIFLLLTQSRTALGAVVLAFLFSLCIYKVRRRGVGSLVPPIAAATLFTSVVLSLALLSPDISLSRLTRETIMRERDKGNPFALTGRVYLWPIVLEYAGERPILGYGHDAFWSPERIEEISMRQNWAVGSAHNGYLEMLVNLGVVDFCFIQLLLYAVQ